MSRIIWPQISLLRSKMSKTKSIFLPYRSYIILLAKTYYTDETTEGKFAEYIEEIIDEKNVREPLINKIKSLKHQYNSTSNEQPQT